MSIDRLPPYGLFPEHYRYHGDGDGKIPGDWPDGAESFREWRIERMDEIRNNIWPEWVDGKGWEGRAASRAYEMTKREIAVMTSEFSKTDILDQKPNHSSSNYTHLDHYEFEDGRLRGRLFDELRGKIVKPRIGHNYFLYDNSPDTDAEREAFLDAVAASYTSKANQFYFWFKNRLMRPRPYQVALIFGQRGFTSRRAMTAMHSAIVSGHATTGIMIRCGALERWLEKGQVPAPRLDAFKQYIMDVGDRRVFAGVHYPTDNISSWTLALTLIPKMYRHADKIGSIVRKAIRNHSRVYEVIDRVYRQDDYLAPTVEILDRHMRDRA